MDKLIDTFTELVTKELIVGSVLVLINALLALMSSKFQKFIKKLVSRFKSKKITDKFKNKEVVYTLMTEMRVKLECNRIFICLFHIGSKPKFDPEEWLRYSFTCTHEAKEIQLINLVGRLKDEKVSNHGNFIKKILEDEILIFDDVTEEQDDFAYLYLTGEYGLDDFVILRLENSKNEIIGFMGVNWDNKHIDEDIVETIYIFTKRIKGMI